MLSQFIVIVYTQKEMCPLYLTYQPTKIIQVTAHRVNEDEGSQVSVCDPMALEPDGDHITITGLKAEGPGHLDIPAKKTKVSHFGPNLSVFPYVSDYGHYCQYNIAERTQNVSNMSMPYERDDD